MIGTDDPRQGTVAGYVAGCRCAHCKRSKARYEAQRRYDNHRGIVRIADTQPIRRRVQALRALGWTMREIAARTSSTPDQLEHSLRLQTMTATRAQELRAAYDAMCMVTPPSTWQTDRLRRLAAKKGWAPPLAWDNIDTDDHPQLTDTTTTAADWVVVERALLGQRVTATPTERDEIVRRWQAAGKSLSKLNRLQGWNTHRDQRKSAA